MNFATKMKPGLIVAFDNFFTSFSLLKNLASKIIFACGAVKSNSKGLPDFMKKNKINNKNDKNSKRRVNGWIKNQFGFYHLHTARDKWQVFVVGSEMDRK